MFSRSDNWFVVLPDVELPVAAAGQLHQHSTQVLRHSSGRPWVVGNWSPDDLRTEVTTEGAVAVLGVCGATPAELRQAVRDTNGGARARPIRFAGSGSCHVIVRGRSGVRVQGTVSGVRRVFSTELAGLTLASDRSDVLAALTGAPIRPEVVAAKLLYPMGPTAVERVPPWRGVESVPEHSFLLLHAATGKGECVQWWRPPEPSLSLREGAELLRSRLTAAVELRTRSGGTIGCDLSGGLDSTPLCFLAADGESRVVAFTSGGRNDDDVRWADRAAAHMPGLVRDVVPPEDMPLPYDSVSRLPVGGEEPFVGTANGARIAFTAKRLAEQGCRGHIGGHGGDEVLAAPETYLHDLLRDDPREGVRHIRGYRALRRWSRRETVSAFLRRQPYERCVEEYVAALGGARPAASSPPDPWGVEVLRTPPWATGHALDIARGHVRAALSSPVRDAIDPRRPARQAQLDLVRGSGNAVRQVQQLMAASGLPMEAPLLDDDVVEACLSVRPHELTTPWRYKPLMVEAMRGVVPDDILARETKADGLPEVHAGRRRHLEEIVALCEDSRLASLGLVDGKRLRDHALSMGTNAWPVALWRTLACETWLRALERSRTPATPPAPRTAVVPDRAEGVQP
ncbi:asparagine synthase [Streptomyces sp. OF3]|uniref:asparagine synthase (glutamine-hydrolyzing) n=1 Tax=Streptomyces alkaliterrae TaxID=2213162 RepID=A0A7W3ZLE7_9ACTN|nr:asparagine synthase [Streptomyces alkaliterrae]MBB1252703.1 asparagine synthase [Streptomyces alkaliterrae]